jgi:serine/threonine protein kinase
MLSSLYSTLGPSRFVDYAMMGAPPKSPSKSPSKSPRKSRSKSRSPSRSRTRVVPPPPSRRPSAPTRVLIPSPTKLDVIGKGGYGCAIRPVIPCKDETQNIRAHRLLKGSKTLSKVFFNNIFNIEDHIRNVQDKNRRALITGAKDIGVKSVECEIKPKYRRIAGCNNGATGELAPIQLIMEDLGKYNVYDMFRSSKNHRDFINNLAVISLDEIIDTIESNLVSIEKLHTGGFGHFDIKAENTMVEFTPRFRLRLIDLDLMKQLDKPTVLQNNKGKYRYSHVYYHPADFNYLALKFSGDSEPRGYSSYSEFYKAKFIEHIVTMKGWCGDEIYAIQTELAKVPGKSIDESVTEVFDRNRLYIDELYNEMIRSGRFSNPRFLDYIKGIDYYMYGMMIIPLLLKYKKEIGGGSKRLDDLIDRLSLFINLEITKRERRI